MRATKHVLTMLKASRVRRAAGFRALPARRLLHLTGFGALLAAVSLLPAASPSAHASPEAGRATAAAFSPNPFGPLALYSSRNYPVGTSPRAIATGLFNGNSNGADLVTANVSGNNVSVLLNNGGGLFGTPRNFAVGQHPSHLVVGDFSGLGRRDVAVANPDSNTVSVLICRGDGTFQPARNYPAGDGPFGIAAGDFNRDGRLDLVVTNRGVTQGMSVLLGNGDGTFQPARSTYEFQGSDLVVAAQLNGDGKLDLIKNDYNNIIVQLGNGDGTFGPPTYFSANNQISGEAVGDVNGDGRQDIVTSNVLNGYGSVLLGNGDGTFRPQLTYYAGSHGFSVALADLNNDSVLDVITPISPIYNPPDGSDSHTLSVAFGNGDGTFRPRRSYVLNSFSPVDATVADFNRDGWRDIAVANEGTSDVTVLLNNGNGTF